MPKLIFVDLDGTLAQYNGWKGISDIGNPVPVMANRVKQWLNSGDTVKIFTARVSQKHDGRDIKLAKQAIKEWTLKHFGKALEAVSDKDRSTKVM